MTVGEANRAPTLDPVGNQSVDEQTLLSFTATASDPDLPANTLLFSLVGAPAGAVIDPNLGDFTWTPTEGQGPGVYVFDIVVTDIDTSDILLTIDESAISENGGSATGTVSITTPLTSLELSLSTASLMWTKKEYTKRC